MINSDRVGSLSYFVVAVVLFLVFLLNNKEPSYGLGKDFTYSCGLFFFLLYLIENKSDE